MTYEEALKTCEMALKAIGMSHTPYNDSSTTEIIKEMSKEHDIKTIMMCVEKQIPKKPKGVFCPSCGFDCDSDAQSPFPKYCQNCGQSLYWGEEVR